MNRALENHEFARLLAVLEERMKTMQAEYWTDIARLAEDMAKRDKDNSRWHATLFIATVGVIGIATAILGFLIRLPPAAAV